MDDTRAVLVQDFIYAQALKAYARVGGVGFVSPEEPRGNLTGDPWFTDGNRAVMLLTDAPTDVIEISWFDWTEPIKPVRVTGKLITGSPESYSLISWDLGAVDVAVEPWVVVLLGDGVGEER